MSMKQPLLLCVWAVLASACFADSERCEPGMSYNAERNVCTCAANAVAIEGGCLACASDEVVLADGCGCAAGETKNDASICAVAPGLGDPCSAAQPCTDTTYNHCAPASAGSTAGTCTTTCASDADCGSTRTCATWEAQPYCRDFSGVGESCAMDGDCAGFDAQSCDTYRTHTCKVKGCSVDTDDCPRDSTCCDLSAFGVGTVCLEMCP